MADKIEALEKVGKSLKKGMQNPANLALELQPETRLAPNKDHFDSLMLNKTESIEARKVDTTKTSLVDEVGRLHRRVEGVKNIPPGELLAQAQEVMGQIESIKGKLNSPNVEIQSSVQNLLRNKLSHIDESLKVALNKAGVEYVAPKKNVSPHPNPIERFLGFLTDGQYQLQTLASNVEAMHLNRKEISPATMLSLQIKVGFIQQELEFFTSLLNKALESTKTIMNVQV